MAKIHSETFKISSSDPFINLLKITVSDNVFLLAANDSDVVADGGTYKAANFHLSFPLDNGEEKQSFSVVIDNTVDITLNGNSLLQIVRSHYDSLIQAEVALIFLSESGKTKTFSNLVITNANYDYKKIEFFLSANYVLDLEIPSERYQQQNFPGLFL